MVFPLAISAASSEVAREADAQRKDASRGVRTTLGHLNAAGLDDERINVRRAGAADLDKGDAAFSDEDVFLRVCVEGLDLLRVCAEFRTEEGDDFWLAEEGPFVRAIFFFIFFVWAE
ncbi:MAG: hypothetical protein ACRYG8_10900 [Janthinobacterium lividum]